MDYLDYCDGLVNATFHLPHFILLHVETVPQPLYLCKYCLFCSVCRATFNGVVDGRSQGP